MGLGADELRETQGCGRLKAFPVNVFAEVMRVVVGINHVRFEPVLVLIRL